MMMVLQPLLTVLSSLSQDELSHARITGSRPISYLQNSMLNCLLLLCTFPYPNGADDASWGNTLKVEFQELVQYWRQ